MTRQYSYREPLPGGSSIDESESVPFRFNNAQNDWFGLLKSFIKFDLKNGTDYVLLFTNMFPFSPDFFDSSYLDNLTEDEYNRNIKALSLALKEVESYD